MYTGIFACWNRTNTTLFCAGYHAAFNLLVWTTHFKHTRHVIKCNIIIIFEINGLELTTNRFMRRVLENTCRTFYSITSLTWGHTTGHLCNLTVSGPVDILLISRTYNRLLTVDINVLSKHIIIQKSYVLIFYYTFLTCVQEKSKTLYIYCDVDINHLVALKLISTIWKRIQ